MLKSKFIKTPHPLWRRVEDKKRQGILQNQKELIGSQGGGYFADLISNKFLLCPWLATGNKRRIKH